MDPEGAVRFLFRGRHTGRIDPPGFAPTGRPVNVEGVSILRLVDRQAGQRRALVDSTGVARQIDAAPAAGSRGERAVALLQRARARAGRLLRRPT